MTRKKHIRLKASTRKHLAASHILRSITAIPERTPAYGKGTPSGRRARTRLARAYRGVRRKSGHAVARESHRQLARI